MASPTMDLSILYLRCTAAFQILRGCALRAAFNSLFEMLGYQLLDAVEPLEDAFQFSI